jgi:hypothetical protein
VPPVAPDRRPPEERQPEEEEALDLIFQQPDQADPDSSTVPPPTTDEAFFSHDRHEDAVPAGLPWRLLLLSSVALLFWLQTLGDRPSTLGSRPERRRHPGRKPQANSPR